MADFLRTNLNDSVPWEMACSTVPWRGEAPNHGFMLRDGQRVVGTLLALYSERLIAGRVERFCNLGSWCVLPAYRSRSISLLSALLAQSDFHFTVLSPDRGSQEILPWLKFHFLDTSAALIPNMPWPSVPRRTRISAKPEVIERTLTGSELKIYLDHVGSLAAQHLVLIRRGEHCFVMYREFKYRDVPVFAVVLHVSNPGLFRLALPQLGRHLLVRHRLVATMAELRIIEHRPRLSFRLDDWPKLLRSASLEPEQIDYLYSELECVPWSRGSFPGRRSKVVGAQGGPRHAAKPSRRFDDEKKAASL
ncbi:hypothetical protein [Mycolicibacterium komossense]|uniref:hypothetical protein n=1 Tax=Mycolicibacterium komossense TaxID=1779 RepID=UPI0021F38FBF|nr:hypothetical protein [Mycolicibacterium komossense]